MQDEILKNFDKHIFYHGTSLVGAKKIFQKRFLEGHGILGDGVYITSNWLIAIWAIVSWKRYDLIYPETKGGVILRVNISKGTRILNSAIKPDRKCLQYLRKEFGKEILSKHPRKVIPENKRLTQREFINLFRYHYWEAYEKNKCRFDKIPHSFWYTLRKSAGTEKRENLHMDLLFNLMTSLKVQYQFDGFGNPEDDAGIVMFDGKHLEVKEFVFQHHTDYMDHEIRKILYECHSPFEELWLNPKSNLRKKFPDVNHLRKYFRKHGSKEAKELAVQIAKAAKKKS